MKRYIITIRPEMDNSLAPEALAAQIDKITGLEIVEGRGRRTLTVEVQGDDHRAFVERLPSGLSVRAYQPLSLLR